MTFPSAAAGAPPGETIMASLATNAVRTRLALTTFLSNGGEHRLSHVRVLLREVIHSAHECGMNELVNALSTCEAMLTTEGTTQTTHARALDGALRALAPRPARPAPADAPIFDENAPAAAPAPAPAPAVASELGSPLELVLQATECASSAAASRAPSSALVSLPVAVTAPVLEDDFAFAKGDACDTDVDDAPVFAPDPSLPIGRPSLLISLTPPPVTAALLAPSAITLTPWPSEDVVLELAATSLVAPAPPVHRRLPRPLQPVPVIARPEPAVTFRVEVQPELSPEPITAVIAPKPAPFAHPAAAFVSPEALKELLANDVLAVPPGRARERREERAEVLEKESPLHDVRAAYLVIAILLGLLLGFVARTMVISGAAGSLAPTLMLVSGAR